MDHAYHTKVMLLEACESSSPEKSHSKALTAELPDPFYEFMPVHQNIVDLGKCVV